MKKTMVLDIGPGEKPYKPKENECVTSIDFNKKFKPTMVHDLTKFPWPIKKNSFDKIYASHIIEHIPPQLNLWKKFIE